MFYYLVESIGFEPPPIGLWAPPKYQKIISRCGCFFYPDRPPVGFDSKLKSSVEKHNVEIQAYAHKVYAHPVNHHS